jgi:DNA excision repair protein ERCC-4
MVSTPTSTSVRRIVIDTREKHPYSFDGSDRGTIRKALPAGDYSLEGFEDSIAIERKSLDDWVNTIIHNRGRFTKELAKLRDYLFAAVVIEASIHDVMTHQYKSDTTPGSVLNISNSIDMAYAPVRVVFAGSRAAGVATVLSLLTLAERRYGAQQ